MLVLSNGTEVRLPLPIAVCARHRSPKIVAAMLRPDVLRALEQALRRRRMNVSELVVAQIEYERIS